MTTSRFPILQLEDPSFILVSSAVVVYDNYKETKFYCKICTPYLRFDFFQDLNNAVVKINLLGFFQMVAGLFPFSQQLLCFSEDLTSADRNS